MGCTGIIAAQGHAHAFAGVREMHATVTTFSVRDHLVFILQHPPWQHGFKRFYLRRADLGLG